MTIMPDPESAVNTTLEIDVRSLRQSTKGAKLTTVVVRQRRPREH